MAKQLLGYILFITSWGVSAQQSTTGLLDLDVQESVYVHYNTNTLVTGETLYLKLYCYDQKSKQLSRLSKIAYVELLSEEGLLSRKKVALNNGVANVDFFMATNYNTGNYKIVCYTKWMLNQPEEKLFVQDIFVINPYSYNETQENNKVLDTVSEVKDFRVIKSDSQIILTKKTFATRERLSFQLANKEHVANGKFSISVRRLDSIEAFVEQHSITNISNKTIENSNSIHPKKYFPELRGEIISGYAYDKSGEALSNQTLTFSSAIPQQDFKLVTTDKNGYFNVVAEPAYGSTITFFDALNSDSEISKIVLDSIAPKTYEYQNKRFLNYTVRKNLEDRIQAAQIENAYYNFRKDSVLEIKENLIFNSKYIRTYILDDYERFESLKETFLEVTPEIYTKTAHGETKILVRDYENENNQVYGNTVIFVDGVYQKSHEALLAYSAKNVEKIQVINRGYILGDIIANGVILVYTKTKDFYVQAQTLESQKVKTLARLEPKKKYFKQEYYSNSNDRIPDYRYQLYWNPNFDPVKDEMYFYTSDVTGTFEMVIKGFTSSGDPYQTTTTFTVK